MTDEKSAPQKLVDTHERTESAKAPQSLSARELVINKCREAYLAGQSNAGVGDAIKLGAVLFAAFITLMSLAVGESAGLSAFITGILVGVALGVFLVVRYPWGFTPPDTSQHPRQAFVDKPTQ
jgi:hypothetical protein